MAGRRGSIRKVVSSRGIVSYEVDLWHDELGKHRTVRGSDPYFVERIAHVQLETWQDQWSRKQVAIARSVQAKEQQESREAKKRFQEQQQQLASERTSEAEWLIESLSNVLRHTLSRNDAIEWEELKDRTRFAKPEPLKPVPPPRPVPPSVSPEPTPEDPKYQPEWTLMDRLIAARREQKRTRARQQYEQDHALWQERKSKAREASAVQEKAYEELLSSLDLAHRREHEAWLQEHAAFLKRQEDQNASIERQKEQYLSGCPESVVGYCEMVLSNSEYPDFFPKEYELDYNAENRVLVVDYSLPAPNAMPTLAEVKYVAARDDFVEKQLSAAQVAKLYDDVLYQVTLRTIHELFEADQVAALDTIAFNGYVRSIDKGTGTEANACVLSVQARREEFLKINLANVDAKICFKQLKGVGSPKLHSVVSVAPIMRIRRDDGRFVSPYDVAEQLDEGFNLAAMDWEDFEHLIREVFAKEFSSSGGEVQVTQASRDGGVDAVAFDPDPIRGGKIVIQAKRYTNTVGVAAVRDLYGTVMNEGATKGILVTTSDYGPDAYEFANGKPLTLLSGANLLHLLEKHGHRAKIDLQEARRLAMERAAKPQY